MIKNAKKVKLTDYAPVGAKYCEMKCDRKVIKSSDGHSIIICDGCKRIIMEFK